MDEYHVPLQEGFLNNYYDDIINLVRGVFSSSLKGNDYMDFGVVTGILRVSGESLFSTFNNPKVYSILNESYNEIQKVEDGFISTSGMINRKRLNIIK